MIRRLRKHVWFTRELARYSRERLGLAEAKAILRRRLDTREAAFLAAARRCIFANPHSPYLPLLRAAGCELGDLEREVRRRGLEPTLERLQDEGVYVTFEELKGRRPILRRGIAHPVQADDFDNPVYRAVLRGRTGGTTGPGTSVPVNLAFHREMNVNVLVHLATHGLLGVPSASWFGALPDSTGLINQLRFLVLGQPAERWFVPADGRGLNTDWRNRLLTRYAVGVSRWTGAGMPWPQPVGFDRPVEIARWMRDALDRAGRCMLRTHVSKGLRVATAAREAGIDLTGAVVHGAGEVPTEAKTEGLRATGIHYVSSYYFSEGGALGLGCADPVDDNDNHFFKDSFALVQRRVEVPGAGRTVDAFSFTSLLASAPKVLLNAEIDDFGLVETRRCGCELGSLGLTEHLRHIRSARKLTAEGVTLVGSDMLRILDEVLPRRLGGSPLDYQILEEEDGGGRTRITLLVSPDVPVRDDGTVVAAVRAALREAGTEGRMTEAVWGPAGALRVRRERPVWTPAGKLMPLHSTVRRLGRPAGDSEHGGSG